MTTKTTQTAQNAVRDLIVLAERQQGQITTLNDRVDELKEQVEHLQAQRQELWNFNYAIRHDIKGWTRLLDKQNVSKMSEQTAKEFLKRTRDILNDVRGKYPDKNW